MTIEQIKKELKKNVRHGSLEGKARFGIDVSNAYGVTIPIQRKLAKEIGKDHKFAQELWKEGIHETRIIASMVDEPDKVTKSQMNKWANDFNSWDLCDQCCNNLFVYTPYAHEKAIEWSRSKKNL
ncbi:MAG: DNA alkylation repair protein [Melioribacteraceae bacterium]|nr:DNA alkylation repair protein [Melioribacteraceae bacterium]